MQAWPVFRNFTRTRPLGRMDRVGIGENDKRGVPAEFHGDSFELPSAFPGQLLSHGRGAGKGELGHGRIGNENPAHGLRIPGRDQIDHSGGESRRREKP